MNSQRITNESEVNYLHSNKILILIKSIQIIIIINIEWIIFNYYKLFIFIKFILYLKFF